jgi:hypothetical protein
MRCSGRRAPPLIPDVRHQVMRVAIVVACLLCVPTAFACRERAEDRTHNAELDLAAQRKLVPQLAIQADHIVVATLIRAPDQHIPSSAQYLINVVLKGELHVNELATFELPNFIVVGCTVAETFESVSTVQGVEYLLYVRYGALVRTGKMQREWPEISAKEEMQLVHATLR